MHDFKRSAKARRHLSVRIQLDHLTTVLKWIDLFATIALVRFGRPNRLGNLFAVNETREIGARQLQATVDSVSAT
jgi:hypothetical protein